MKLLWISLAVASIAAGAHAQAEDEDCGPDDPTGQLSDVFGATCAQLTALTACETDLNQLNSVMPVGSLLELSCPTTCHACSSSTTPEPPTGECRDDPTGVLAATNATCAQLAAITSCEQDLNQLNSAVPAGSLLKLACPATCNACSSSTTPAADDDTVDPTSAMSPDGAAFDYTEMCSACQNIEAFDTTPDCVDYSRSTCAMDGVADIMSLCEPCFNSDVDARSVVQCDAMARAILDKRCGPDGKPTTVYAADADDTASLDGDNSGAILVSYSTLSLIAAGVFVALW